jgi:hypothetical protein
MKIPALCEKRPVYQGRLVPFSVKWFDGVPDFKVVDPAAVERCIHERLCGVCGTVIGARVTFVGGPASIANRLFTDPGMHRACAEYAMSVCPFLNGDIRQMATAHKNAAEITTNEAVSPVRPTTFGYLETANYVLATYDGEVYIHPSPGTIRWVKERV